MRVLAVIPVYNHAATLRAVAAAALAQGLPVLVVDDGSTDGGLDRLAGLDLRCLRCGRNRGKGRAILRAAALARLWGYDAILTLDADGQHDPADAGPLLAAAEAAWPAIAVGARRMAAPEAPRSSRFGRWFSDFWVRLECGQAPVDSQSGYRVYPVAFLLSRRFSCRRYGFEVEVLVRGAWAGLPLVTAPVSVYYPPAAERVSHFHRFKDNLRLACLHTALLTRSLLPWPHRRIRPRPPAGAGLLRRLLREHAGPGELAAAVGMGIFLAALPIMPFGLAVIVYVNGKLHLNRLAGAAASNLCVVPVVPFLCIQTGHLLLHGSLWTEFNRVTLLRQLHLRLWEWLLGSLLLGPLLGVAGAALTYVLVRRATRHRHDVSMQDGTRELKISLFGADDKLDPRIVENEEAIEGVAMTANVESILTETRKRMKSSIETLKKEMATVRTGRANAGILDSLHVEYYGSMMPINQIAGVSVPEASMLVITPFDKKSIKAIETAILKSELGLNPANDGNVIRLPIPPLNEERRRDLTRVVSRMGEEIKTAVRNVRRDSNEDVKKLEKDKTAPLSEDAAKKALEQIQKVTDETIKEVDEVVKHKETEIMHV